MLSSTYFVATTSPLRVSSAVPIVIFANFDKSATDPTGVVGLLLSISFFFASIVALFSHCDSVAGPPSSSVSGAISGRSSGTLDELGSLLLKCRRWESLLGFDLSLVCEETDLAETVDELLEWLPKNPFFRVSALPSMNKDGSDEVADENVGGLIISCVCVSVLRKVNTAGGSCATSRGASTTGGAFPSDTFSFFLRISRKTILYSNEATRDIVERVELAGVSWVDDMYRGAFFSLE